MNTFLVTLILAILIAFFCAIGLGIGRLITGKTMFSCNKCGKLPGSKKDSCSLCKNRNKCKKK